MPTTWVKAGVTPLTHVLAGTSKQKASAHVSLSVHNQFDLLASELDQVDTASVAKNIDMGNCTIVPVNDRIEILSPQAELSLLSPPPLSLALQVISDIPP